jgi:hypothetical protein
LPSLGLEPDSDLDLDPDLDSDLDPDLDLDPGDAEADLAGQPPFDAPAAPRIPACASWRRRRNTATFAVRRSAGSRSRTG